jgi:ribosome-associated toxin RatA of RatAB toxin-antitoxin module
MAIDVAFEFEFEFDVMASAREVFDVLSDVPTAAGFFPLVDKLIDLGNGAYRWEIARIGTEKVNVQTNYVSKYSSSRKNGTVTWSAVEGEGNALFSGNWKITDNKTFTSIRLEMQGQQSVALPKIMKTLVHPIVTAEHEVLVKYWIHNLTKRFGGEANPPE